MIIDAIATSVSLCIIYIAIVTFILQLQTVVSETWPNVFFEEYW